MHDAQNWMQFTAHKQNSMRRIRYTMNDVLCSATKKCANFVRRDLYEP